MMQAQCSAQQQDPARWWGRGRPFSFLLKSIYIDIIFTFDHTGSSRVELVFKDLEGDGTWNISHGIAQSCAGRHSEGGANAIHAPAAVSPLSKYIVDILAVKVIDSIPRNQRLRLSMPWIYATLLLFLPFSSSSFQPKIASRRDLIPLYRSFQAASIQDMGLLKGLLEQASGHTKPSSSCQNRHQGTRP
jgi:hypothetical protein